MRSPTLLVAILLLTASVLYAQPVDTIKPASSPVTLRKAWEQFGPDGQSSFGRSSGSIGDVYGSGFPAWAMYTYPSAQNEDQTWVYSWDSAAERVIRQQVLRGIGGMGPGTRMCAGHFVPGRRPFYLGYFAHESIGIYQTDSLYIDTVRIGELHPAYKPGLFVGDNPIDAAVADLDGDSLDDLVLLWPTRIEGAVNSQYPELWIYRGGATFPRSDTPDVVIVDTGKKWNSGFAGRLYISDVDGDHQLDIITMGNYEPADSCRCTIYRLQAGNPFDTSTITRHVCASAAGFYLRDAAFGDINGDSLPDYAIYHLDEPNKVYLFTSSPGNTLDKRVLTAANADAVWYTPEFSLLTYLGPLNDSTGRWGMFSVNGAAFSGGKPTPDARWDANGAIGTRSYPMGDATGDGWPDALSVSGTGQGYAALLAGGPEIPRDLSSGVEWFAVAGEHERALAVWPNPAREVVHIAWRGDLRRMPQRFLIHDLTGELVAEGSTDGTGGEVFWDCSARPNGSYLCTVLDRAGATLATTRLLVEH